MAVNYPAAPASVPTLADLNNYTQRLTPEDLGGIAKGTVLVVVDSNNNNPVFVVFGEVNGGEVLLDGESRRIINGELHQGYSAWDYV